MTDPLTRAEARRVLGVPATAGADAVKRAYRRLAREHHPDRGGDPDTFHRLRLAFEQLSTNDDAPRPAVARGRPSRPEAPRGVEHEPADLASVDWDVPVPHNARLDRDRLAVWLADQQADAGKRPVLATSRAPGSRLNRLAPKLAPELTSRLEVVHGRDDRGRVIVAIDLVASNRRARRALDRVALDGAWTRTRRSASTLLRTTLTPSPDPRTTAVRVTDRVAALLDRLDWPLETWTATVTSGAGTS